MNLLAKNYKESMDGVKMPNQLKSRIIKNTPARLSRRRRRLVWMRRITGVAAAAVICCLLCFVIAVYQAPPVGSPMTGQSRPQIIVGDAGDVSVGSDGGVMNSKLSENRQSDSGGGLNGSKKLPEREKYSVLESLTVWPYPPISTKDAETVDKGISAEDLQLLKDLKIPQYIPDGYVMSNVNRKDKGPAQITYESPNDTLVYNVRTGISDLTKYKGDDYVSYTITIDDKNSVLLKSNDGLCYDVIWVDDDGNTYSVSSENGLAQETVSIIVDSVSYVGTTSPSVSYEINQ